METERRFLVYNVLLLLIAFGVTVLTGVAWSSNPESRYIYPSIRSLRALQAPLMLTFYKILMNGEAWNARGQRDRILVLTFVQYVTLYAAVWSIMAGMGTATEYTLTAISALSRHVILFILLISSFVASGYRLPRPRSEPFAYLCAPYSIGITIGQFFVPNRTLSGTITTFTNAYAVILFIIAVSFNLKIDKFAVVINGPIPCSTSGSGIASIVFWLRSFTSSAAVHVVVVLGLARILRACILELLSRADSVLDKEAAAVLVLPTQFAEKVILTALFIDIPSWLAFFVVLFVLQIVDVISSSGVLNEWWYMNCKGGHARGSKRLAFYIAAKYRFAQQDAYAEMMAPPMVLVMVLGEYLLSGRIGTRLLTAKLSNSEIEIYMIRLLIIWFVELACCWIGTHWFDQRMRRIKRRFMMPERSKTFRKPLQLDGTSIQMKCIKNESKECGTKSSLGNSCTIGTSISTPSSIEIHSTTSSIQNVPMEVKATQDASVSPLTVMDHKSKDPPSTSERTHQTALELKQELTLRCPTLDPLLTLEEANAKHRWKYRMVYLLSGLTQFYAIFIWFRSDARP